MNGLWVIFLPSKKLTLVCGKLIKISGTPPWNCFGLFCHGTSSLIFSDSMADQIKYGWNFQNLQETWNRWKTARNVARRQPHRCQFQIRFLGFWNIIVLQRDRTKSNRVSLIFTVFSVIWIRCIIKSKSQQWCDLHARCPWWMKLFAMTHGSFQSWNSTLLLKQLLGKL